MLKVWIVLAFMLTAPPAAALQPPSDKAVSKELTGKVVGIIKGDTIDVLTDDKTRQKFGSDRTASTRRKRANYSATTHM